MNINNRIFRKRRPRFAYPLLVIVCFFSAVLIGCAGPPEAAGTGSAAAEDGASGGTDGGAVTTSAQQSDTADSSENIAEEKTMPEELAGKQIAGMWEGYIIAGSSRIKTILHLEKKDGAYTASIDSPEQGATGIPVETVRVDGETVVLEIPSVSARYEGRIVFSDVGAERITGVWMQGGGKFTLDFVPADPETAMRRPQDPQPPFPYISEDVTFENEEAGITLAGTITRPEGPGPFPSIILVSGSGPQDRNEEVFNHRPFLVLADHLSRNGIAVLRYDDRGAGASGGDGGFDAATSIDLAGDAAAAFEFLLRQPYSDDGCTGMLGHSEGGIIVGSLAADRDEIGLVILLASPGLPGDELLVLQSAAVQRAMGLNENIITMSKKANREIYGIVTSTADNEAAAEKIRSVMQGLGMNEDQITEQLKVLLSPWYRHFLSYDPREDLKKISCPVLALFGSKDVQVPAEENSSAILQALETGRADDYSVMTLDGLNHLFQHAQSGSIQEYGAIEETFAPEALEAISAWIYGRCGIE